MQRIRIIIFTAIMTTLSSCISKDFKKLPISNYVIIDTTNNLYVYYPIYKSIDFIIGESPKESDTTIVFCCTASFTYKKTLPIDSSMVLGPYAINGNYFNGIQSNTSTGCFLYLNDNWKFASDSIEWQIRKIASEGGWGFSQMSLIPNKVPNSNRNSIFNFCGIRFYKTDNNKLKIRPKRHNYRALCEINKRLCIVESIKKCTFSQFQTYLNDCNFNNAIYLDVGLGWSYAWYRINENKIQRLHQKLHPFGSNWIVFRK